MLALKISSQRYKENPSVAFILKENDRDCGEIDFGLEKCVKFDCTFDSYYFKSIWEGKDGGEGGEGGQGEW